MERKMNMENYFEEENSYFRNVVRDALDDLKNNRQAYAFYQEQVDEIVKAYQNELKTEEKDGIFYLTDIKQYAII